MNVWIGTAGYSYPAWVGGFYPKGTAAAGMLPLYATHVSLDEIRSSFHRSLRPRRGLSEPPRDSY